MSARRVALPASASECEAQTAPRNLRLRGDPGPRPSAKLAQRREAEARSPERSDAGATTRLPRITYVLPVHNQERVIQASVQQLLSHLRAFPGSEVILVENGSTDASPELCTHLESAAEGDAVTVRATRSEQGMGNALRHGIALATGDVLVLTAADLPFGFTDLAALLACSPRPRLAIGSKAHPRSRTRIPLLRRTMSEAFRLLRLAVLGLRVRDTQGTILIDAALAREIAPQLRCADYLISTEIVAWGARLGATPRELPVTYIATPGSTVSPVRDSLRMARGVFALRRRLT